MSTRCFALRAVIIAVLLSLTAAACEKTCRPTPVSAHEIARICTKNKLTDFECIICFYVRNGGLTWTRQSDGLWHAKTSDGELAVTAARWKQCSGL